jgi:hypothetical protein
MRGATESIADALRRRGLAAPARLLLDAHRPLRPLLAETGVFLSPILRPLLGRRYPAIQELLEHDTSYDRLIESLDDAEHR